MGVYLSVRPCVYYPALKKKNKDVKKNIVKQDESDLTEECNKILLMSSNNSRMSIIDTTQTTLF